MSKSNIIEKTNVLVKIAGLPDFKYLPSVNQTGAAYRPAQETANFNYAPLGSNQSTYPVGEGKGFSASPIAPPTMTPKAYDNMPTALVPDSAFTGRNFTSPKPATPEAIKYAPAPEASNNIVNALTGANPSLPTAAPQGSMFQAPAKQGPSFTGMPVDPKSSFNTPQPMTREQMFAKKHGSAFDPNSKMDRLKMQKIKM